MNYTGRALRLGDHIDTDAIIPARFLLTGDPVELGKHCMEGMNPEWIKKVTPGKSLLVAGRNFGCGSSREHAPVAILGAGIPVVMAHSFARIFYRNAFNMGLFLLELGDDVDKFQEGDEITVDVNAGTVSNLTTDAMVNFPPLPQTMQDILHAGGLAPFVRERLCAG